MLAVLHAHREFLLRVFFTVDVTSKGALSEVFSSLFCQATQSVSMYQHCRKQYAFYPVSLSFWALLKNLGLYLTVWRNEAFQSLPRDATARRTQCEHSCRRSPNHHARNPIHPHRHKYTNKEMSSESILPTGDPYVRIRPTSTPAISQVPLTLNHRSPYEGTL